MESSNKGNFLNALWFGWQLAQKVFHRGSFWIIALSIMSDILNKCYQLQKIMEINYLMKTGHSNRMVLECTHQLSQQWYYDNFPNFIPKEHWPPNNHNLNPLDYSIWEELNYTICWNQVKSKKNSN